MSQNTSQKPLYRILIIFSAIAFFGSTAAGVVSVFTSALQEPQNSTTAMPTKDSQLQAQERGYEMVLQREPENQTALQGLVEARIQMKDFQGAVEPLEKLVKLNPDRAEYKALLAEVKQKAGQKSEENTEGDR